ncbi:MAG: TetR-like C-terminal domain-containing protein [Solibacillus sp.]|uniref:TetR/AcrR family transcriptional regulator n=1 Tax=unclassified Solibacillus TaxID=2637870 RepID=UPI0030F89C25
MDLRVKKTHESLQRALLILLKNKSLENISVAELCRIAEINRGTFYLHYKNVHGVFERYFTEIVKDLKLSYEFPYDVTQDNISQLTPEMIQIFHHVKKYESFYRIVFDEKIPMIYYQKLFATIRSFILSFHNEHVQQMPEKQIDYFVSYTANAIIGIILQWHHNNYEETPEQINQYLVNFIRFKDMSF